MIPSVIDRAGDLGDGVHRGEGRGEGGRPGRSRAVHPSCDGQGEVQVRAEGTLLAPVQLPLNPKVVEAPAPRSPL